MSRKAKTKKNNFNIGVVFFALFFSLVFMSLLIKFIVIYKNSTFDGLHRKTVAFYQGEGIKVLSFSPQNKSISLLNVKENIKPEDISSYLRIPVETVIVDKSLDIRKTNIFLNLLGVLLKHKNKSSELTFIDIIRLMLFTRSVPSESIYEKDLVEGSDIARKDYVSSTLFADTAISNDKKRVEIINATEISGFGNRMADALSNLGADVVLVITSEKVEDRSRIYYYGEKTYTISRLSSMFRYPTELAREKSLADVIIILGRDSISTDKF